MKIFHHKADSIFSNLEDPVEYRCMRCGVIEWVPLQQIKIVSALFHRKNKYLPIFRCAICNKANVVPKHHPFTDDAGTVCFPEK